MDFIGAASAICPNPEHGAKSVMLHLKNMKTGETVDISPEGATFGRAGARADIPLRDQAVSKKHARIYLDGSSWFLEDLGSSNGTYLGRTKLSKNDPVALDVGSVFALTARFKFEVLEISSPEMTPDPDEDSENDAPLFDEQANEDISPPPPQPPPKKEPRPKKPAKKAKPVPAQVDVQQPATKTVLPEDLSEEEEEDEDEALGEEDEPEPSPQEKPRKTGMSLPAQDGESSGIGFYVSAMMKACVYYLGAVPKMAVKTKGTIAKSVEQQAFAAMDKMEIMVSAFPALLAASLFGTICTAIGMLFGDDTGFGDAISSSITGILVGVIGSAIGAVIFGFALHPVLGFIISKLQGESDDQSRSNYFMTLMTASILVAIPNGLGTLLTIAGIPILSILGPALLAVATVAMVYVLYTWFKYFQVHNVVLYVILGFGALGVSGSLYGVVTECIASAKALLSDDGDDEKVVVKTDEEAAEEELAAKKAALETAHAKALADLEQELKDEKIPKEDYDKKKKELEDAQTGALAALQSAPSGSGDESGGTGAAEGKEPTPKGPSITYAEFAKLRDSVTAKIKSDPTRLLNGTAMKIYEKIAKANYKALQSFEAAKTKNPALEEVYERQKEIEIYQETTELLKTLSGLLK